MSAHRSLILRLTEEGLRLFFPLAALHAALWPALWSLGQGFDLVFTQTTSPFIWHGYELLIGSYGAALLGFITTALPEWTGTPRPRGGFLYLLAGFWSIGRLVGLGGADSLGFLAALADLAWLAVLTGFVALVSIRRRTSRLLGFLLGLTGLSVAAGTTRLGMLRADMDMAEHGVLLSAYAFLALLGLALARIHPLIVNLILDPSQTTTPFRPHPGRFNLAPGLLACVATGKLVGVSDATLAYLLMAAGAAFLDRTGESFVGKAFFRAEISALAGSSFLAGAGLILWGASLLWGGFAPFFGIHIALMGGLGLAILAVFSIAGLLHTGHSLGLPWTARLALILLAVSLGMRLIPEMGGSSLLAYPSAALLWAAAFLIWLWGYWPWLSGGLDPLPETTCS